MGETWTTCDNTLHALLERREVVAERYDTQNRNFFDELPYVGAWGDNCTKKGREAINSTNNNFVVEQLQADIPPEFANRYNGTFHFVLFTPCEFGCMYYRSFEGSRGWQRLLKNDSEDFWRCLCRRQVSSLGHEYWSRCLDIKGYVIAYLARPSNKH